MNEFTILLLGLCVWLFWILYRVSRAIDSAQKGIALLEKNLERESEELLDDDISSLDLDESLDVVA